MTRTHLRGFAALGLAMSRFAAPALALLIASACFAQEQAPGPAAPAAQKKPFSHGELNPVLIGESLAKAKDTDFFGFFHFEQVSEARDPSRAGLLVRTFDTPGKYKGKAVLQVVTGSNDDIVKDATLVLQGDFVDTPGTVKFARDVAKSFLETSPGFGDAAFDALYLEIGKGCDTGVSEYKAAASGQGFLSTGNCDQGAASPGYKVYLGKLDHFELAQPDGHLLLKNTPQPGGGRVVSIEMSGK